MPPTNLPQLNPKYQLQGYALNGVNYAGTTVAAPAGSLSTVSFTVNNSDFQCLYIMYQATSPALLIQIRTKNRNVFAQPVIIGTIAGTAGGAFPVPLLPGQLTFLNRETVQVDLINISGAPNVVYVTFSGREVK